MIALAVDAGGTSTRCVVVDGDGTCLGRGRGGRGNPISAGLSVAAGSVAAAADCALRAAGVAAVDVDTWLVAMAGGVSEDEHEVFAAPMRHLGVSGDPVFRGDALATFCSGSWRESGYALIVGTGAVAIRVLGGEQVATGDGLGWLLGDEGSGFWIGHRVVRAALAALEGRGPATSLVAPLLAEVGCAATSARSGQGRAMAVTAALEALYRGGPVELARLAPLAFAATSDPVAVAILDEAATALASTLRSVMVPSLSGPVVFGGGTLTHNQAFAERVVAALPLGTDAAVRRVPDGLAGAAVLALRSQGLPVGAEVFARISTSLAALRDR